MDNKEKTKTWAAFGSEYLKAVDVLNDTDEYAVVGVSSKFENGRDTLHLHLERDGTEKLFGCNRTNAYAVQCAEPESPEKVIGRIVTFNKVKVAVPNTEPVEIVDGLRLVFKPKAVTEPASVDTDDAGIDEDSTM